MDEFAKTRIGFLRLMEEIATMECPSQDSV